MAVTRENPFGSRTARIVLALTVTTCFASAFAAAPSASTFNDGRSALAAKARAAFGENTNGVRPLGRGTAMKVARAYDAEDEDCVLVVTKTKDDSGRTKVTRKVACAN